MPDNHIVPDHDVVPDFDITTPHIARIYDYWLGGKDNFEADRKAAELALAATPTVLPGVTANRRFLGRAVQFMATDGGIRQFLDIGTGIPTAHNTHEVAQAIDPDARVVYVDNDPIVLAHARALLTGKPCTTAYVDADARDTSRILAESAATIDFAKPVGVLLIAVLHCIPDADDPGRLVADLLAACPPGSYLAITHPARDQLDVAIKAEESLSKSMGMKVTFRTRSAVEGFFTGHTDLVTPGVVPVEQWRATSELDFNSLPTAMWGGVGRKALCEAAVTGLVSRTRRRFWLRGSPATTVTAGWPPRPSPQTAGTGQRVPASVHVRGPVPRVASGTDNGGSRGGNERAAGRGAGY